MTDLLDAPLNKQRLRLNAAALPAARHPSRLAAGVLLLVICALAASYLYSQAGDRERVLSLVRDVEPGTVISNADLAVVEVATDGQVRTVSASDRPEIVGAVAATRLIAGSLLTPASADRGNALAAGEARVGAALKAGQFPTAMRPGDPVLLIPGAAAPEGVRGTVSSLSPGNEMSGTRSASFDVPLVAAPAVATAGADGSLVVVVIPR